MFGVLDPRDRVKLRMSVDKNFLVRALSEDREASVEAIKRLLVLERPSMLRKAFSISPNEAIAEDIVQDTIIELIDEAERGRYVGKVPRKDRPSVLLDQISVTNPNVFRARVLRSLANTAKDYYKAREQKRRVRPSARQDSPKDLLAMEDLIERNVPPESLLEGEADELSAFEAPSAQRRTVLFEEAGWALDRIKDPLEREILTDLIFGAKPLFKKRKQKPNETDEEYALVQPKVVGKTKLTLADVAEKHNVKVSSVQLARDKYAQAVESGVIRDRPKEEDWMFGRAPESAGWGTIALLALAAGGLWLLFRKKGK